LAEICRGKGIEIMEEVIEKVRLPENADVIANFEVIEHLFNPREFMDACFKLLKPGGFFILTCPNIAGFETQTLKQHSDTIDHEHINYFSPSSLSQLAKCLGFEVLKVHTPGVLDVDIVYERLKDTTKAPVTIDPFLRKLVMDSGQETRDAFQQFLTQNALSSNMMMVCRRPK
jgi:2-polyprenyl-3-methyl-5-hydroxy-6-metoxy-1,4-benzoquinol methylase